MKKRFLDENARWVLSYLKPHTLGLIGILAISFGQSYAFSMLPKASTNFLFELLRPDNIHLIYKYFLLALGLIVIKTVFAFISNYGSEVVVSSAIKKIRNHLFSHLMTLDFAFYSNQKTGDIISISVNDVQEIRGKFYNNLITFISSCMMFTIIMVRLFLLNWLLTLICMGFMPALYIVIRIIGKKLRTVGKQLRKSLADLSVNYHETLTAIDVVKAFSNEEYEKDSFRENTNKHRIHYLHLARLRHILRPLNEMIIYFFGMTLIGIGSIFILRNTWSVKHLTEYLMLLGIMSAPLRGIPTFITGYHIVLASIDRIRYLLEVTPQVAEPPDPVSKKIEGAVTFKHVWFSYNGSENVLKGVSFHAEKGDIMALVGPSGAGKTTMVNLIPRFYDCVSGNIYIDDVNVRRYSLKSLRTQIGIVSQQISLFNTSIMENIRYAKGDATEDEVFEAAKKAYAYDFIMDFPDQFSTSIGEKGVKLSGGQKQRVTIARAVLMNPEILILDEATSALDSESEYYIQLALDELMRGRTSFIIAHRLSTVKHASKILVIEDGRILDIGGHQELLERCQTYNKIYELQYFR